MKKIFTTISFFLLFFNQTFSQILKKYEIQGKIDMVNGVIYLIHYDNNNKRNIDSSRILNNSFYFSGKINGYSDQFYIKMNPKEKRNADSLNAVQIQVEPSKLKLSLNVGKFSKYIMRGCRSCDEFIKIEHETNLEYQNFQKDIQNIKDSILILNKQEQFNKKINHKYLSYLNSRHSSLIKPTLLYLLIQNDISEIKFYDYSKIYNSFSLSLKKSFYGKKIKIELNDYEKFFKLVGKKAYHFKAKDRVGNEFAFEDLIKSKYVLIDFWASWCVPCREETPVIKNLGEYYYNGLQILGISDDNNIESWNNAIEKDKIQNWVNISPDSKLINGIDLDQKIISSKYFVKTIPLLILIDKKGIIIGIYDGSNLNLLEKKLQAIFK